VSESRANVADYGGPQAKDFFEEISGVVEAETGDKIAIDNVRIFVGFDSREPIATYVCMHSLQKQASSILPLSVLRLDKLSKILRRKTGEKQSTEFAFSRFLVPYLSKFKGFSVFVDSDFVFKGNICDLFGTIDPSNAVSVVKHDYKPKTRTKFLNQRQTNYERKNWSSFMIFNNQKCRVLTPEMVSGSTGLYLHRFKWLDDSEIGSIDLRWNYLAGEYPVIEESELKAIHYTIGGPYFREYASGDFADCWMKEFREMKAPLE